MGEVSQFPSWKTKLIGTKKGGPKPIVANILIGFRDAPEFASALAFDLLRQRTIVRKPMPWQNGLYRADQDWTDMDDVHAASWFQHEGITIKPTQIAEVAEAVARERQFHPVLDYLNRCEWDGTLRLEEWISRYLGAEDTPYIRAVAKRWLISAVARVMQPGCKADCCPILEGAQGIKKSTALKVLSQPWFSDEIAEFGTKDASMQVAGVWIMEIAELDAMGKAEVHKIKAFMSRTVDRFRPPYGRRLVEQARQCVFAGTVNSNDYLRDETGGRRFWPIACGRIDTEGLAEARDQLWAEARAAFQADEPWWLDTPELLEQAKREQEARYQTDAWSKHISLYLIGRTDVSIAEVLAEAIGLPKEKWGQIEQNRIARCLKAMNWDRRRIRRPDWDREWRYFAPLSPVVPDALQ